MSTHGKGKPLISVIVPVYNYACYIGEALESVRSQTYPNWECIVVDDGSTDDTREVVEHFCAEDARIHYIWQENQQQGAARNNGLRRACGEYFQFLDADDLLEHEKLERHLEFLEGHPEVDIVYSDIRYFDTGGPHEIRRAANAGEEPWMPLISGSGKSILLRLVRNNIMPVNASLFRRSVIDGVGFFDERLPPVEDWAYLIRCAAAGARFHYGDSEGIRPLVRAHPESSSSDPRRMYRAEILMRETIRSVLKIEEDAARLNERRLAEITGLLGLEEYTHGGRARAAAQFVRAIAMDTRTRFRAKWLLCLVVAPFVTHEQMRRLVTASVSDAVTGALRKTE